VIKTYNGEKVASLTNVAGKLDICMQKTETRSIHITCASINPKWIRNFNIRPDISKLIQERSRNILEAIDISKDFLCRTQEDQQLRERNDKWNYMKLKSSTQQKKWSLN
jgi:hypothetical protein